MKYTLSVLVENESGVLTRIAGLFARRGFNIESLAVGPTEKKDVSRIIMVLVAGNETIQQLIQQLYKLINVLVVKDITMSPTVERELMLIKIQTNLVTRSQIIEIANIFRAKIVDLADNSITLEVTGDPGKIVALEKLVERYKIIEIARTGKISLLRESKVNSEYLKNYSN